MRADEGPGTGPDIGVGDDSLLSLRFQSGSPPASCVWVSGLGADVDMGSREWIKLDSDRPPLPELDKGLDRVSGETVDNGGSVIPPPTFADGDVMILGRESGGGSTSAPRGDSGLIGLAMTVDVISVVPGGGGGCGVSVFGLV